MERTPLFLKKGILSAGVQVSLTLLKKIGDEDAKFLIAVYSEGSK